MHVTVSRTFRLAVLVTIALVAGPALAFHSGGVAECEGCHSMHTPAPGGYALLVGSDGSSACLTCHEHAGDTGPNGYHVSTAVSDMGGEYATGTPLQRAPGGDFGWLKKAYSWVEDGATVIEAGSAHGHSIIAADFGYAFDAMNTVAPGGTMPSANLQCHSCHDPHGQARRRAGNLFAAAPVSGMSTINYRTPALPIIGSGSYNDSPQPGTGEAVGLYRILAGAGYTRGGPGVSFTSYPVAVAPATYNRTEAVTDTRVAYGGVGTSSWGDWCGACHRSYHQNSGAYVHPTEDSLDGLASIYNAYVASGNLSGDGTAAYTSLVPFSESTGNFAQLAVKALTTGSGLAAVGAASSDRVTCMSCHRAHASAFPHALRWQPGYEFITKAGQYVALDNPAVTGSRARIQARGRDLAAQQQAGYYDRPATKFATYQRVLCNKCHGKD